MDEFTELTDEELFAYETKEQTSSIHNHPLMNPNSKKSSSTIRVRRTRANKVKIEREFQRITPIIEMMTNLQCDNKFHAETKVNKLKIGEGFQDHDHPIEYIVHKDETNKEHRALTAGGTLFIDIETVRDMYWKMYAFGNLYEESGLYGNAKRIVISSATNPNKSVKKYGLEECVDVLVYPNGTAIRQIHKRYFFEKLKLKLKNFNLVLDKELRSKPIDKVCGAYIYTRESERGVYHKDTGFTRTDAGYNLNFYMWYKGASENDMMATRYWILRYFTGIEEWKGEVATMCYVPKREVMKMNKEEMTQKYKLKRAFKKQNGFIIDAESESWDELLSIGSLIHLDNEEVQSVVKIALKE
jgi:hypothetical protein